MNFIMTGLYHLVEIGCLLINVYVDSFDLFNVSQKPDICRYGKVESSARALPREMKITDFLFWYYQGGSCSLKNISSMIKFKYVYGIVCP